MPEADTPFSDAEFTSQELKEQNKSLYLCSLYFEDNIRQAAQNIFALFLELKKIPSTISEPMLGEIRTTWWRELIEKGDIEHAGAPLGREIISTIKDHKLDKNLFYELLEGITQDLYLETYATQKDLETYFDQTYGALFSILSRLCSETLNNKKANIYAGRALGYAMSLFETPIALQRNHHYFPEDMLETVSSSSQAVYERRYDAKIATALETMKKLALEHVNKANDELKQLENNTKAAFTPLALIKPMLKMVDKTNNPLTQITPLSPLGFQWHLYRCAKKGQF